MLEFGQIIKKKREEKGWTQKELGEKLYVSNKAISRWENNQSYPDITLLIDLARVLELDYQELLEGHVYIERKKQKRNLWVGCIALFIAFSVTLFASAHKQNVDKGIYDIGINFLVSCKWDHYGYDSKDNDWMNGGLAHTLYQQQQILEYLAVDRWQEVDTIPNGAHFLFELYVSNDKKEEVFEIYHYENTSFIKDINQGFVYVVNKDISGWENFHQQLTLYNYDFDHEIENLTSMRQVSVEEISNFRHDGTGFNFKWDIKVGTLKSSSDTKEYWYITSQECDIQKISYDGVNLILEGKDRLYTKPYICIYEVPEDMVIEGAYYQEEYVPSDSRFINEKISE